MFQIWIFLLQKKVAGGIQEFFCSEKYISSRKFRRLCYLGIVFNLEFKHNLFIFSFSSFEMILFNFQEIETKNSLEKKKSTDTIYKKKTVKKHKKKNISMQQREGER